jgi:hypothetical protein
MYIRTVTNNVNFHVTVTFVTWFYNIVFQDKHQTYTASGSAPLPIKNMGWAPGPQYIKGGNYFNLHIFMAL